MVMSSLAAAAAFVFSPYTYLPATPTPAADGQPLTLAFASGECGEERWGEASGQEVADANVARLAAAGTGYIVSTGGQGNVFTCASNAGMERFVARYMSPRLIGFDFDIEASQTPAQVASLMARIAHVKKRHPHLRFSFTIATHAASDGSKRSLNKMGEGVLAALRRHKVRDYVLNLMVMDYGPADSKVCAVREGRCDMAASAMQAARNVHEKYRVPYAQIELTPMIGVNDVVENIYTLDDARVVAQAVRKQGMAGLHFWSVERDRPCPQPVKAASPSCSGIQDTTPGDFQRTMAGALK